jgi:hypothetical protein
MMNCDPAGTLRLVEHIQAVGAEAIHHHGKERFSVRLLVQ